MANNINIYGRLKSMTGDGVIAISQEIYDTQLGKFQSEINDEFSPKNVTWAALVGLRNSNKLITGNKYRITDYTAVINSNVTNAISAGHLFDIIVEATSDSTLSELAAATLHEGDTYFQNCKMEAWELKYCIDNDVTRFSWASSGLGKGVIYWMKDEFENEAPFDFKNIGFKRKTDSYGNYSESGTTKWCHVFNFYDQTQVTTGIMNYFDLSVLAALPVNPDRITDYKCFGNKICTYYNASGSGQSRMSLPDIVLLSASGYTSPIICSNNVFGQNCKNITVGHQAKNNSFGEDCQAIILGTYSRHNVFGNYCCYINLDTGCYYNTIGTGSWNVNFVKYTRQTILNSAVIYANIKSSGNTPTSTVYLRNCEVKGGTYGTSSAYGDIAFDCGVSYPQVAYLSKEGNIIVNSADMTNMYVTQEEFNQIFA